jgi:N-acetylglucosamine kinase-like BadF-type ATPase
MNNFRENTILIADSGSTKTDWVFARRGEAFFQFQSAGMNPFYQSRDDVADILEKEVLPNISGQIDAIFFYGAGCANEVTSRPVTDALKRTFPEVSRIEVASDMLGAARGLCGREAGIAGILGTGANNALYDGKEIIGSIGSLGFWLGDEGSGSYLGKTLVVAYLQNELPEDLHVLFATKYPEINRLFVLEYAYKKPFPNRYFASFSVFISENVKHPFISVMIGEAFGIFVKKYILKHSGVETQKISFTGSIAFYYQDILREVLIRHGLEVGKILKSPLNGLISYHLELPH